MTLNKSKNIFLTLNRSKKLTAKLPWEKPDASAFFLRPLPTGIPPWLLGPMRVSTSSELYPDTGLFLFFECLGIQFLIHPPTPDTVSQATYGYLPLTVQHLCYLWGAMPRQRSPGAFPPTVPREAENFPRGDKHFKLYDHPNL